jgi:hypothetical protein
MRRLFWRAVHGLVAHPLLVVADIADAFHDWTAKKGWPE